MHRDRQAGADVEGGVKNTNDRIDRSAAGLRGALFEQLEKLRNREVDPREAMAFAALAGQIIKAAEVQLKYEQARLENRLPSTLGLMPLVPTDEAQT